MNIHIDKYKLAELCIIIGSIIMTVVAIGIIFWIVVDAQAYAQIAALNILDNHNVRIDPSLPLPENMTLPEKRRMSHVRLGFVL